jgi:hypothetical protein
LILSDIKDFLVLPVLFFNFFVADFNEVDRFLCRSVSRRFFHIIEVVTSAIRLICVCAAIVLNLSSSKVTLGFSLGRGFTSWMSGGFDF